MKQFFILTPLLVLFSLMVNSTIAQEQVVKKVEAKAFYAQTKNLKEGILLDVRTADEFKDGHIKNAKNIDWYNDSFKKDVGALAKDQPIYIYCRSGGRSSSAVRLLKSMGFQTIVELQGGMMAWQRAKLPSVK